MSQENAVDLFERTDEKSVLNLVSPQLQNAFLESSRAAPDYFGLDERDLHDKLRADGKLPSPTDNRLRLAFWLEYDRAQEREEKMTIQNIYAGVCGRTYFYNRYLGNPAKVAWLLTPPTSYDLHLTEALSYGMDRLREMLAISPLGPGGKVNVKLMELQTKIVAMLDVRKHGMATQKVEQKNMNLHVSTTNEQVAKMAVTGTMEQLERRMKELERRERHILSLPEKKDHEVVGMDPKVVDVDIVD